MTLLSPKPLLRLEGLAALVGACLVYRHLHGSWALFAVLFLVPDAAMAGYLVGPATGARAYNVFHTYTAPGLMILSAAAASTNVAVLAGLVWFAHIGMDRCLGFGLKYAVSFKDTHLSRV